MIGIYKITNKLNGKSYIGQSIHCGKRLDEHCKGTQFIDEIIQLNGISNFTFEIIHESNKNDLSFWEDYYIIKYNTYFPNGYNKKWNCSSEIRQVIQQSLKNSVSTKQIRQKIENTIIEEESNKKLEMIELMNEEQSFEYLARQTEEEKMQLWMVNARKIEQKMHSKDRICNTSDYEKYLKRQELEIKNRNHFKSILSYTNKQLKQCTQAEKRWIKDIEEYIEKYNNGESLWHIDTTTGCPIYSQANWEFTSNSIIYYFNNKHGITKNNNAFIPINSLIKKGILNTKYLIYTTDKGKMSDINSIDKLYIYSLIFLCPQ